MTNSYKKFLNKSKLILSDFDTDTFTQNYSVKMLINNNISGLLSAELDMINSLPVISYDITAKHSVLSVLENKKINFSLFSSIIQGLHKLCYTLNDYMLDNCFLLLSPEYIFLDGSLITPYFCYCPVSEDSNTYSFTTQLRTFLEYVISKLNYEDKNCVAYVYSLHQKCIEETLCTDDLVYVCDEYYSDINTNIEEGNHNKFNTCTFTDNFAVDSNNSSIINKDINIINKNINKDNADLNDDIFMDDNLSFNICGFNISSFLALSLLGLLSILTISCGLYMYFIKNTISSALAIFICLFGPAILLSYIPSALKKRKSFKENIIQKGNRTFNEDTVLNTPDCRNITDYSKHIMPIGETMLISSNQAKLTPHLIYNGNDFSDNIELSSFPFTIGKLPDCVNHIMDNMLISRIHARFYLKEECYYIEDLNSSNGTYVNSVPLSPHTLTEIHDGDNITLACLTYTFKMC